MNRELQAITRKSEHDVVDNLIGWWLEAGVDAPVGESPRDWLRRNATSPVPQPMVAAENPTDLESFRTWLATANNLPMGRSGAIRIMPQGIEGAKIMFLSDLPTHEDVAESRPIGGEAWVLATRMLAAIGLTPDDAYVASLSCFHSPGSRLSRDELEICADMARNHIRLARPKRLILFGDTPSRALLGEPLARARGRVYRIESIRTIATFHPRWLLQRPSDKALAWKDLLLLMSESD